MIFGMLSGFVLDGGLETGAKSEAQKLSMITMTKYFMI
jgi:hypothetical protein